MNSPFAPTSAGDALLEVCCGSADAAIVASTAGAGRVELCANLVEGGTTPSVGTVALALDQVSVPIMVMIRPRGGDFLYSPLEFDVMLRDVASMKEIGADGVVLGVLQADGRIDGERTGRLVDVARPMAVTFHRAFDVSRDLFESLATLGDIGVDRVLTSAGRGSVLDGLDVLAELAQSESEGTALLPAGGIRAHNVAEVLAVPGIREVHVGASRTVPSAMEHRVAGVEMGRAYTPDEYAREEADEGLIGDLRAAMSEARQGLGQ